MLVEVKEGEYVIIEGESLQCYEGGEACQDYGSSGLVAVSWGEWFDTFGLPHLCASENIDAGHGELLAATNVVIYHGYNLKIDNYSCGLRMWYLSPGNNNSIVISTILFRNGEIFGGSSVRESQLSEKLDHLPIKKQRFVFREPSQPTFDTPGTESVAP
nr:hypothetical protein [Tanacetum cinerariifolium]